jgi:HK97 family phage major capsid protein
MEPDRVSLLAQAQNILNKPSFSREDSARVDGLLALADAATDRSELRRATLESRNAELGRPPLPASQPDRRFTAYMRGGPDTLTAEERRTMGIGAAGMRRIQGALQVSTGGAGGYLVPQSFSTVLEAMLKATDPIFMLSTLFETETGSVTNYPLIDDTSAEATLVAESGSSVETDNTFYALGFGLTGTWRSGIIKVSIELIQDSAFNIESVVAASCGIRFARGIGAAFTSTLLGAADAAITTASSSAIAASEVIALTAKIDSAYLPGASFLMARATYIALTQLVGSSGNFMFPAVVDSDGDARLLGFKVFFSPSIPAIGAGNIVIAFGQMNRFIHRRVLNSTRLHVYHELFAASGTWGFEAFTRRDGLLSVSGAAGVNNPIALLTMHS